MSEAKHTPGPWEYDTVPTSVGHCHRIGTREQLDAPKQVGKLAGYACVYVDYNRCAGEAEANAQLMAAAPELLEALRACIESKCRERRNAVHPSRRFCEVCGTNSEEHVHHANCPILAAELAIAKAEGK